MSAEPRKPSGIEKAPLAIRSLGFCIMLCAWWAFTIELPARNLREILNRPNVIREWHPLTEWARDVGESCVQYRWLALIFIILAVGIHIFLWKRHPHLDVYGKWVFRMGFLVFYIILYGMFILMFLGAEIPIWTWPTDLSLPVQESP